MTAQRLTRVQRDVLDRLRDGWKIPKVYCAGDYRLCKDGEPSRHVADATVLSLVRRDLIRKENRTDWAWVLA